MGFSRIAVLTALLLTAGTACAEEDWRSQWRAVLPGVPAPADSTEAEEVFWTYYVERDAGTRACLDVVRVLNVTYERLVSAGTTTAESSGMVKAALYHCIEVATGSADRQDLLHALAQAGLAETIVLRRNASQGEPISHSLEEVQRIGRRIERRSAHLLRWKALDKRMLDEVTQ